MKCVLCGRTAVGRERFTLGLGVLAILKRRFPSANTEEICTNYGVCDECLELPPVERIKLAGSSLCDELDEYRRGLLKSALEKRRN
jgi:hypothetical protein